MRRLLTCLLPWMAMAVAWAQSAAGLTVDYTYRGTFMDQGVRSNGCCYVTPGLMRKLGWTVDVDNGVATILADGRTLQLESNIIDGRRLYCLDEALRQLGGSLSWDEDSQRATVLSRVESVQVANQTLRVRASLAVRPRAFRASNPDRMVIDLAGAQMGEGSAISLPAGWSVTQADATTVRVTVASAAVARQAVPNLTEGREFEIALVSTAAGTGRPVVSTATLGAPKLGSETDTALTLLLPIAGRSQQRPSAVFLDPTTIQVVVPGTGSDATGEAKIGPSRFLSGVSVDDDKQGTCTVTIRLQRPLAFELGTDDSGVTLSLNRPRARGGLAGKVIVVDAGHGGHDNGAVHAGVEEKHQTLAMAKTVAAALKEAGASIIMTRTDDTFIPLNERPGMANRSHADLFISCHHNSNSVDGSRSGIIVFHHKGNAMGMLLAECLSHEIAKERQLPDMGVWSDGRIYQSGFAVLRGATMPAVLMELGFLNHPTDRSKIQAQEFRDAIARAVVRGVKEFFGDGRKD